MDKTVRRRKQSQLGETWHRLKKNKVAIVCLFIILSIIIIAVLAPVIAPYPYAQQV